MKKILLIFFIILLISSCGEIKQRVNIETKNNDIKIQNKVNTGIIISKNDDNTNLELEYNDKNNENKNKEDKNSFLFFTREQQIKIVRNKNCFSFENLDERKICLSIKTDLDIENLGKMTKKSQLKYDCNKLKKRLDDTEYLASYEYCMALKKVANKYYTEEKLSKKLHNGDLSYCSEVEVKRRKGFNLDNCKIGVIVKSDKKDCSLLPNGLQKDCEELKAFVIEEEKKRIERNRKMRILDLVQ